MRPIQSASNPKIQQARKILNRKDPVRLLIEGIKLLEEAISSGMIPEDVFVTEEISNHYRDLIKKLERKNIPIHMISAKLMRQISDVETPPGIIGIAKRPAVAKTNFEQVAVLLISIRDPGNFGAIIRSSEATGCKLIYYSSDCADPFQPKAIRSSMGSIFRMQLVEIKNPQSFLLQQKENNIHICGLIVHGGQSLFDWKPQKPILFCIGSESHGLPESLPLTEKISIPMQGKVESLNAAVATSLCLYWIRYQAMSVLK